MKRFKSNYVRNIKFHANEMREENAFTYGVMYYGELHEYGLSTFRYAYDMLHRGLRDNRKTGSLDHAYIVNNRTGEILVGWYGSANKWGC